MILKKLFLLISILLYTSIGYCALEDFTTYTEVDEDGDLTVTSTKVDVSSMAQTPVSYVTKDFDAGHFGDFEHFIDIRATAFSADFGACAFHHISNTVAATRTALGTANIGYWAWIQRMSGNNPGTLFENFDGDDLDFATISLDTTYYCTIQRTSTALELRLYSDSDRTTLLDTVSITRTATTFRYAGPMASLEGGGGQSITCFTENLDLNEAAPAAGAPQVIIMF